MTLSEASMPPATSTTAPGEELLDINTVAALFGCSRQHVRNLFLGGKMPRPIRLGWLIRWRRSELMGWLASSCPPVPASTEGLRPDAVRE